MKSVVKKREQIIKKINSKDIKRNIVPNKFEICIENSRGYNLKTLENIKPIEIRCSNDIIKSYNK